jgi:hypothetical protein
MNAEGQVDEQFATEWLRLLLRPNVREILRLPLTMGRKMSKILCTLAADEYGELEFKWYDCTKKVKDLEKRVEEVRIYNESCNILHQNSYVGIVKLYLQLCFIIDHPYRRKQLLRDCRRN